MEFETDINFYLDEIAEMQRTLTLTKAQVAYWQKKAKDLEVEIETINGDKKNA